MPEPRGPLSRILGDTLIGRLTISADLMECARESATASVISNDDVQVSLLTLYELHYRGITGVSERWEWDPNLLAVRALLEGRFEAELRDRTVLPTLDGRGVAETLFTLTAPSPGRDTGLAVHLARTGTIEQYREFLTHRSIYHLKEADPHSWAIPRLAGSAKAALVEVQTDEYGGGRPERMHSTLFADTMRGLGLDPTYGRYVDRVPAVALAGVNAMSLFGLHRRLLGAIVGHLAAFEMTSSLPNRSYGNGLRRLGYGPDATRFFDEHVEADAVHEQIAGRDLAQGLAEQEPARIPDILFGAAACVMLDDLAADHLLFCFRAGVSSLYDGVDLLAAAASGP